MWLKRLSVTGMSQDFKPCARNFGWLLKARQRNLQSTGIKIAS
jgi:hypothetical protein